jgi:20S proteasome subunit alpha 2
LTSSSTNGRPILFQVRFDSLLSINGSLTTFSPSGKLAQIEYALAAVGQGLPSLGIRCSNGVVLASEKPHTSILSDQSSFEKISRITPDAGVVYSGMGPDSRVLVDKARKAAHVINRP